MAINAPWETDIAVNHRTFSTQMEQYRFIFSNERKYRLRRHFTFWFIWFVFQGFIYSFVAIRYPIGYFSRLPLSFIESFIYLAPHIFLAYALMYFVIPVYVLKQKYWKALGWSIVAAFVAAVLSAALSLTVISWARGHFYETISFDQGNSRGITIFLSIMAGFRGGLTIGGIAATIKLMKYWYLKEQRNLQLQKQNAESQLQLLKAQVHPHFLFNTLNNIYSHTQTSSPVASQMITGLSGILRFMLYESSQEVVPLSKELKMVSDYIELERVRYGTGLDLQVRLPEQAEEYYITPLLLLPLVENSFKHGASTMLDQPWVSLDITLDGNRMQMKLINAKTERRGSPESSGIGIRNVRERLALLYPGRHEFVTRDEDDVFIVNLKIQLSKVHTVGNRQPQTQKGYD